MAFSEIVPCFDPCVCVLGIFAVIFPDFQLLLTNIYFSVRAYAGISYLETSETRRKKLPPAPTLGTHVVVAMLILFLYSVFFFIYLLYPKQKSNNSLVVRLAIYGSVNRFFQACAITGKRGLFED